MCWDVRGKAREGEGEGEGEVWGLEKCEVGEGVWQVREERIRSALREAWFRFVAVPAFSVCFLCFSFERAAAGA